MQMSLAPEDLCREIAIGVGRIALLRWERGFESCRIRRGILGCRNAARDEASASGNLFCEKATMISTAASTPFWPPCFTISYQRFPVGSA